MNRVTSIVCVATVLYVGNATKAFAEVAEATQSRRLDLLAAVRITKEPEVKRRAIQELSVRFPEDEVVVGQLIHELTEPIMFAYQNDLVLGIALSPNTGTRLLIQRLRRANDNPQIESRLLLALACMGTNVARWRYELKPLIEAKTNSMSSAEGRVCLAHIARDGGESIAQLLCRTNNRLTVERVLRAISLSRGAVDESPKVVNSIAMLLEPISENSMLAAVVIGSLGSRSGFLKDEMRKAYDAASRADKVTAYGIAYSLSLARLEGESETQELREAARLAGRVSWGRADFAVAYSAVSALVGDEQTRQLCVLLNDADEDIAVGACRLLAAIGYPSQMCSTELLERLRRDRRQAVRESAASALAFACPSEKVLQIEDALNVEVIPSVRIRLSHAVRIVKLVRE